MKVTGPGEPPVPPAPEGAADATPAGAAEAEEAGPPFADRLRGAGAAAGADRTAAVATPGVAPPDRVAVSDLAADLQAGRLTRDGAVQKLLDRVIARQVGADAAPAVREKVRAALADALESDPLLAEKLKSLGP